MKKCDYVCPYSPCAGCSRRDGGDMGHWSVGQVEAGAGQAPEAEVHTPLLPSILALMALTLSSPRPRGAHRLGVVSENSTVTYSVE